MPRTIACAYPTLDDPDLTGQIAILEQAGADSILASRTPNAGRAAQAKAQAKLIGMVRPGDTVLLTSFEQVATSLLDLIRFLNRLDDLQVSVTCIAPKVSTKDTEIRDIFRALHKLHTRDSGQKIRQGIALRQKAGGDWGRSRRLSHGDWPTVSSMLKTQRITDVAAHFGVTRQTIYNFKRQMEGATDPASSEPTAATIKRATSDIS